ncbi:MAG: hypothetical protein O3C43_22905 [Verrucomicrobia bacterium]|nr:hypothetical protein [Verrucomicrobiota bacterium]
MIQRASFSFLLILFSVVSILAVPGDPDDTLTFFGPRPIYANGGKPDVIVDDFGWLDDTRTDQELAQIAAAIEEWSEAGIGYAAYYALGVVESAAGAAALGDAGKLMDLDGSAGSWFMYTRSAFREYMVNSGKTAVDLGANYFLLDNASPNLETLSFDNEIIAEFRTYLEANYTAGELTAMGVADVTSFDYRDYLKSAPGGNYTDSDSVNSNPPSGELWAAWIRNMQKSERAFFEEWTSSIRAYSQSEYSREIYFGGNRYSGPRQWDTIDKMDFGIAETFLDSHGYPYYNLDHINKNIRNFGKRFWSWGFPANTGSLNGSNDPYGMLHITELSKIFLSETLSSGALHQIPIGWVSYHNNANRLAPLAPYYEFARSHSEMFNLEEAGELAVVYNEAYELSNPNDFTPGYQGIMMLLGDAHRPFDVLFAGHPDKRDGADPFALADLTKYKAIVLPNTRRLTDAQVSKLESYLSGGGVVIGLGQIADLDEAGNDVSGVRTLDNYFISDGSTTVGSGQAICISTNLGDNYHGNAATSSGESQWEVTAGNLASLASYQSTWAAAVDSIVDQDFTGALSRLAHLHRYRDPADGSHIYQVVNRDINMTENVDDQSINDTTAVACSVRIPAGFDASTVTLSWMTVEAPIPLELAFTPNGDHLEFTLPAFSVWGILKVGTAASSPSDINETPESVFNLIADSGGNRPDTFDSDGSIAYNYSYWKGGNHGSIPWDIPYLATDDTEVDLVRLYHRFSSDNVTWGDWTLHSALDVTGGNISGNLSFDAPEGEGYYQFRIQAVDDAGQEEVVLPGRDETGYGVDETAPIPPANVVEASHESGTWIADASNLVFTWDEPMDNLSGYLQANVSLGSDSENIAESNLTENELGWSPTLSGLIPGERYKLNFRHEDEAGNWAGGVELFSFRYGTLPVMDLENIAVTEGDGKLTVTWTNPSDANYNFASFSYREAGDLYATWTGGGLSPDSSATSHELTGLTNGTTYQVRAIAVSSGDQNGNELIVTGTYTPGEGLGGGGGGPDPVAAPTNLTTQDNTANVRLEWMDNATDETGIVIEYKLQNSETWDTVATLGPNAVAFVHNLNIGSDSYDYRVKAIRDSESSDYSNIAGISRSGGGGPNPPQAPTDLSAQDNNAKIDLQWTDNSDNETGFAIARRVQGSPNWTPVSTTGPNTTTYQDSSDIPTGTYEYRVKAINGELSSGFSNVASVTRTQSGGDEINLTAIISGQTELHILIDSSRTVQFLDDHIASTIQPTPSSLEIFLGNSKLTNLDQSLEAAGFRDEDQFTVLIEGQAEVEDYVVWQLNLFGDEHQDRKANEDKNNDGIPNILHYALGTDPVAQHNAGNPLSIVQDPNACSIIYSRSKTASGVTYLLEGSSDSMKTWNQASQMGITESVKDAPELGYELVCWTLPDNPPPNLIVRLRVELNQ